MGAIGDELQARSAPGGGATGAERWMGKSRDGSGRKIQGKELTARVRGEEDVIAGGGKKVGIGGGGEESGGETEPTGGSRVEDTKEGVAREALGEDKEAGARGGGGVETAEIGGGEERGKGPGNGAEEEKIRDGEAEKDLVDQLRREKAQPHGSVARRLRPITVHLKQRFSAFDAFLWIPSIYTVLDRGFHIRCVTPNSKQTSLLTWLYPIGP